MINFIWQEFPQLTVDQLYALLKLRSEVFVVEQNCPYLDPDGADSIALHLLGIENNILAAYLRVFLPTPKRDHIVFGRVTTCPTLRKKGYGIQLMQEFLKYCSENFPTTAIHCSAQVYLINFYEKFGFHAYGSPYTEDNIPHIKMQRTP